MTRISIKALLIAVPLMLALDTIGGILLLSLFAGDQLQEGLSADQINDAILAITISDGYLFCSLIFGSLTTLFGAYLAASIAKTYPYFNAAVFGLIAVMLGFMLASETPFWYSALAYSSTLPVALCGGHLAKRRRHGQLH